MCIDSLLLVLCRDSDHCWLKRLIGGFFFHFVSAGWGEAAGVALLSLLPVLASGGELGEAGASCWPLVRGAPYGLVKSDLENIRRRRAEVHFAAAPFLLSAISSDIRIGLIAQMDRLKSARIFAS